MASYGGTDETTIYIGGLVEKVTRSGVVAWQHYIGAGAGPVAVYTRKDTGTNAIHYLTTDHLGSVDSVTNAAGAIEVRLSFASFGARRNEAGWSGAPTSGDLTQIEATTRRGFTSHEMLDNLNLTHMNGRVYDPAVGRFLSADPVVQAPGFTQSFNRYAYVWNSPLSFADPSGFEAVGRRWLCIDGQCRSTSNPIGDAWPRVQQPNRESQVSGNGVGNDPASPPITRDPPQPADPSTGACVPGATPGFNPADGMCNVPAQSKCLANAPEGLAAANEAWRNNDDPGRTYTVDASKLSVRQIGPYSNDGRALGVVEGPDFLVFGNVTLLRDSTGTITIEAERYDFEMHGASWHGGSQTRAFARNAETFLGFLAATHGGWTEFWSGLHGGNLATDFTFEFVCSPQVN